MEVEDSVVVAADNDDDVVVTIALVATVVVVDVVAAGTVVNTGQKVMPAIPYNLDLEEKRTRSSKETKSIYILVCMQRRYAAQLIKIAGYRNKPLK